MTLLLPIKKALAWANDISLRAYLTLTLGLGALVNAFADSNSPFGGVSIDAADLESKTGSTTNHTLQEILLGAGVLLCVGCSSTAWILVSNNKKDKEEQTLGVIQMLLLILGGFIGLALIGIGWKGATTTVTPA